MAFPKPTAVKLTELNKEEKAQFKSAQLYRLFLIMQQVVNKDVADKAIRNYDKSTRTMVIKGLILHTSKEELTK